MPTVNQVTAHALAVKQAADSLKSAMVLIDQVIAYNSVNDPGWNDLPTELPAAVTADGVVSGTEMTPGDVSNAIGSLTMFQNCWRGQAVTTSSWGQNIEKIAKPIA